MQHNMENNAEIEVECASDKYCEGRLYDKEEVGSCGGIEDASACVPAQSISDPNEDSTMPKPISFKRQWVIKNLPHWSHSLLPNGWIKVTHESGVPIFFHTETKVISLSRPYFLGDSNLKSHCIPVTAIPCLYYKKVCESSLNNKTAKRSGSPLCPPFDAKCSRSNYDHLNTENEFECIDADIQMNEDKRISVEESNDESVVEKKNNLEFLTPEEFRNYCSKKFEFEELQVPYFATYSDKCKYYKEVRRLGGSNDLPADASNIILSQKLGRSKSKCKTQVKSALCRLHEHCVSVLRKPLEYEEFFTNIRLQPFGFRVKIDDVVYGSGTGASKKAAKTAAAEETLKLLNVPSNDNANLDVSVFDNYKPDSSSIQELSCMLSTPNPYVVLKKLLEYNCFQTSKIKEIVKSHGGRVDVQLSTGSFTATGNASDKLHAKSLAAQQILMKMYPEISNWSGFLSLHDKITNAHISRCNEIKEKARTEENLSPNWTIINKIREELLKLNKGQDELQFPHKLFYYDPSKIPDVNDEK